MPCDQAIDVDLQAGTRNRQRVGRVHDQIEHHEFPWLPHVARRKPNQVHHLGEPGELPPPLLGTRVGIDLRAMQRRAWPALGGSATLPCQALVCPAPPVILADEPDG